MPRSKVAPGPEAVPATLAPPVREVTNDDIRVRAYFLSLEHVGNGRSPVDFWLQAERELREAILNDE